jgi:prepilin-type N-terminal cleavage/methylation domain-containing protein
MKNKAFTLVEMIIVSTIMAIVAVGVATSFLAGMRVWGRVQNIHVAQADIFTSFEMFARDLRQIAPAAGYNFTGTEDELVFPTAGADGLMYRVYRYDHARKDLVKAQRIREDGDTDFTETPSVTLAHFDTCVFSYLAPDDIGGYDWTGEWDEAQTAFRSVRVKYEFAGKEYERTVTLPSAPPVVKK